MPRQVQLMPTRLGLRIRTVTTVPTPQVLSILIPITITMATGIKLARQPVTQQAFQIQRPPRRQPHLMKPGMIRLQLPVTPQHRAMTAVIRPVQLAVKQAELPKLVRGPINQLKLLGLTQKATNLTAPNPAKRAWISERSWLRAAYNSFFYGMM